MSFTIFPTIISYDDNIFTNIKNHDDKYYSHILYEKWVICNKNTNYKSIQIVVLKKKSLNSPSSIII